MDAAIATGRYTLDQLCDLAHAADAGFDRSLFAAMVRHIDRLDSTDRDSIGTQVSVCL